MYLRFALNCSNLSREYHSRLLRTKASPASGTTPSCPVAFPLLRIVVFAQR